MSMKSSFLPQSSVLLLLPAALLAATMEVRAVVEIQKERTKHYPKEPERPAPGRPAVAPNQPNPAAARNPLTGSSVTADRPKPAAPRPANPPAAKPAPPAVAKPAPLPGNPEPSKRPAPANSGPSQGNSKGPVSGPVTRPAPNSPATPMTRPTPNSPASPMTRPTPNPQVTRPAPTLPATRPAPSPPGNFTNRPPTNGIHLPTPLPQTKPAFVPGKVTYPGQVSRPPAPPKTPKPVHPAHHANRPQPRPLDHVIGYGNGNSNNRITSSQKVTNINNTNINNVTHITNINNNWGSQWTNNSATVWNNNQMVNNRPVVINPNFTHSVNYAYRPTAWGARPWWSSSTYHSWHHGSWNYGWNRHWQRYHRPHVRPAGVHLPGYHLPYHDDDDHFGSTVAWGIAAWSLGRLAFDSGYNSYRNPYQAPPVQTQRTVINYTMPMSVVASKEAPEPEAEALNSQEKSTAAIERARGRFASGDYLAALKSTDEAIAYAAGDSALHEFRGLCLFALGRYGDAAGVLNPVLASGPGWDWSTMAAFYPDSEIYTGQLRKLESYVAANPKSADCQFLLGYHYMVVGFIDQAYVMFDRVVELQPADTVAAQLRNLAKSSSPDAGEEVPSPGGTAAPAPAAEPLEPAEIEGSWKASSLEGKAIGLSLGSDGKFSWNYEGSGGTVLAGDWSIDQKGQLVLATTDVQMVGDITLDGDTLKFVLEGAPVGDPGLSFQRQ